MLQTKEGILIICWNCFDVFYVFILRLNSLNSQTFAMHFAGNFEDFKYVDVKRILSKYLLSLYTILHFKKLNSLKLARIVD